VVKPNKATWFSSRPDGRLYQQPASLTKYRPVRDCASGSSEDVLLRRTCRKFWSQDSRPWG